MDHGRMHWYEPAELTAEQRTVYDAIAGGPRAQGTQAFALTDAAGRLHGPFNAMLASPGVGSALQGLGAAIRYGTQLSDRAREIAILEVAALRRSGFEQYAHERVGRACGLTAGELDALRTGADAPTLAPDEALIREVVRRLVRDRDLDDETFARAHAALGTRTLWELTALAGYYDALALSLRVWRTPVPAD